MPSEKMVEVWKAMITTVPGWIILGSMLIFFTFLGFKIFVGTHTERLLEKVVIKNHQELTVSLDRLHRGVENLAQVLQQVFLRGP